MFMTEKDAAKQVIETLQNAGYVAYLVGGCVRDMILGRMPKDFDVTTNARPEQVMALFEKTLPVGAKFGVVIVMIEMAQIEVATFRADGTYSDGRRPDEVVYSDSVKDDVTRRDFTINGLLVRPDDGKSYDITEEMVPVDKEDGDWEALIVADHVGGLKDLRNRVIRCIGDADTRFAEDHLRMLRAVRFAGQIGFDIHPDTMDAIVRNADKIETVSRERIREELVKLTQSKYAVKGLSLLFSTGLFARIFGREFVKNHSAALTLERFTKFKPTLDPVSGLSMLFADVKGNALFHVIDSLKLPNEQTDELMGATYMRAQIGLAHQMSRADIIKMVRQPGMRPFALDLFEQDVEMGIYAADCLEDLAKVRKLTKKDIWPEPMVQGRDLIEMGFEPGKYFSRVIDEAEVHQLNEQFATKEDALKFAKIAAVAFRSDPFRKDLSAFPESWRTKGIRHGYGE
jgi:tRNA nucleotidyltransferase/poly(A) polymerase